MWSPLKNFLLSKAQICEFSLELQFNITNSLGKQQTLPSSKTYLRVVNHQTVGRPQSRGRIDKCEGQSRLVWLP